jgi:DNA-binding NarL/FixJ family response regulator
MDAPPVQYATTSDGVHIAYFSLGTGPPVVWASAMYGDAFLYRKGLPFVKLTVDAMLEAGFRIVLYDVRGMGASDRQVDDMGLDGRVKDLEAVIGALGLKRFVLAGLDLACVTAIAYAARHPGDVSGLVLLEPWASGTQKRELASMRLAFSTQAAGDDWLTWTNVLASIVTGFRDHDLGRLLASAIQESTSPRQLAAYIRTTEQINVTQLLPRVAAPGLVIHYSDTTVGSLELARDVASGLSHARFLVTETRQAWPAIRQFLMEELGRRDSERLGGLSEREIEVLRLLAAGRSNQQIADELVISLNTVRRHVSNIFDKAGVANRVEAAAYARDHGLP